MAEPATLPGDEPNTIRSGGHEGKVAVQNPLTGDIALVEPDDAAHRVYSMGWQPVSQADATRADAHQLLKESITPGESIGLGLARGVSGGLVDLAPQSEGLRRATQATDEAFPWLTPIAEGAGFLSPLGVGAGLSAGGEAVTGALRGGQELGLLGKAATRAAGMGAEGSVYGGIGAARQSQIEDTPLTAQKLLSGMFGGAIVGGGLGAGVGAAEGASSLIRGMFKSSGGAREELNAPGLRDSDISPILERNGQAPLETGALDKLRSMLYNGISPETMAAASASKGIRDDMMFAAGPQRAAAEARFAEALNDLHGGNQAALDGWAGSLKRDKVASWIGPDSEHVSDAGNLVAHLERLDLPARNDLAEQIANAVAAQGKKNPEAFGELMNSMSATRKEDVVLNLRRALLHGDKDVLNNLFESKLLNDGNITKLDIAGESAAPGLNDLLHPAAPSKLEPAWQTAALDYVDKQAGYLRELEAQPKGYIAGKGKGGIKNLRELMEGAAKSIKEGDRANAFMELDMVKKRLAVARGAAGPRIPADEAVAGIAGNMHEEARRLLEDPAVWGAKAASAQREMNAILHERFTRNNDFYNAFYTGAGTVDPTNDWAEKLVADPAKIQSAMDRLGNPARSLELQQFKTHIAESNKLADIMEKYYSPDGVMKKQIADMRAGTVKANNAMDDALHFALRENQGKILFGVAHGGARGMASSIAAYVLGGPLGLAGAAAGRALMNPGRIWRMQAIVERMVGSHGGRFAEGMAGLVGKAGSAAKGATRAVGSAAMLTQDVVSRQKAYHETLQDLAAMASNRDMVVKALASWHGPDFAHLPQSIPAMAESIMRGAQFALQCAPARPQPGIFSDDELGLLSDSEAEEWSNTVHAAMDPVAVLGFIKHGQLTPQVLKAAEVASPELVAEMRDQAAQLLAGTDRSVKIDPVHQAGLTMLLGITPNPTYLFALQESWKASAQPTKKISVGNMGDTGVNERYSKSTYSAADRLESGEHQP